MQDCLHEAMDVGRWTTVLSGARNGDVHLIPRDTREPSPFSHELLNANPYAFLDDAPLEERRTRAIATRRSNVPDDYRDLCRLDSQAIEQVRLEAWPIVRDADELHDALSTLMLLEAAEVEPWIDWLHTLVSDGRAVGVSFASGKRFWMATENIPIVRAGYADATFEPQPKLPAALDVVCGVEDAGLAVVRGRMAHCGPTTATTLAEQLGIAREEKVSAALEALEGKGLVLRGHFTGNAQNAEDGLDPSEIEWCDRRLFARIHRLTLEGLRRKIQPVEPVHHVRFLLDHHGIAMHSNVAIPSPALSGEWGGPVGVREVISLLQGFEMPAASWEATLLARVPGYQPEWLDELFHSGEVMWGRLRRPRREMASGPSMGAMTRAMPISLLLRDDLPWLSPTFGDTPPERPSLRANADRVLETLTHRGALFFQELVTLTDQLPSHLEDALRELAALGLITSDGFTAVRKIIGGRPSKSSRRRSCHDSRAARTPVGRWSTFPGVVAKVSFTEKIDRWCRQLLTRYGVVYRDMVRRETAAPAWLELLPRFRRLELRGEVRGGRFVNNVAGEQYAAEESVPQLRRFRDLESASEWGLLHAPDPLNLSGVIDNGQRVPSSHKNLVVVRDGELVAAKVAGKISFFQDVGGQRDEIQVALRTGARPPGRQNGYSLSSFRAGFSPSTLGAD